MYVKCIRKHLKIFVSWFEYASQIKAPKTGLNDNTRISIQIYIFTSVVRHSFGGNLSSALK